MEAQNISKNNNISESGGPEETQNNVFLNINPNEKKGINILNNSNNNSQNNNDNINPNNENIQVRNVPENINNLNSQIEANKKDNRSCTEKCPFCFCKIRCKFCVKICNQQEREEYLSKKPINGFILLAIFFYLLFGLSILGRYLIDIFNCCCNCVGNYSESVSKNFQVLRTGQTMREVGVREDVVRKYEKRELGKIHKDFMNSIKNN